MVMTDFHPKHFLGLSFKISTDYFTIYISKMNYKDTGELIETNRYLIIVFIYKTPSSQSKQQIKHLRSLKMNGMLLMTIRRIIPH